MTMSSKVSTVVPFKAKNSMNPTEKAKLARLPAPVHQVQEKGKQLFLKALRALFDNADDALFSLADKATNNNDQNMYFESMREVRIQRRTVESKFMEDMEESFADLVREERANTQETSSDNLSLVQDDELEAMVAVDKMAAKANELCGESLQLLSLRLDSLVPIKVYQKNNPVGPSVVSTLFVDRVNSLTIDFKVKLVLFKLFDHYVVKQMPHIYEQLNNVLIDANVLPSLQPQALRQTASRPSTSHTSAPQTQNAPVGQSVAPNAAPSTGIALGNHSGASATHSGQQGVTSGAASAPSDPNAMLLQALSQVQTQQSDQWIQHPAGTVAAVQAEINNVLGYLLKNSQNVGDKQNDVINLVKMLFEFILDDRNLAEPMKALIGRLQIPILKVAIMDSSFFSTPGHPARRLLNEIATASVGWQEDPSAEAGDEPKDPLYRKISDIVHNLLTGFETDQSMFSDALADFVSFIDKEKRRAALLEKRMVDAEDGKAKAEAARAQVAKALAKVIGDNQLPDAASALLADAWNNVMFLICLKEGGKSAAWGEAIRTAEDIVWSVTTPVDAASRKALLTMIPNLIKRLRKGLESISFNPFELTKLLSQLEKLHLDRLKAPVPANAPSPVPTANGGSKSVVPETPDRSSTRAESNQRPALKAVQPANTPASPSSPSQEALKPVQEAPKAALKAEIQAETSTGNSSTSASAANIQQEYLSLVQRLTHGTWFEMVDEQDRKYRCRLAAIIKATGKYIFVNRSGMKVAEETAESLALALQGGSLTLLDDTMLFDRALEAVIGSKRAKGVTKGSE
ncbi:DUF1631 domain-containing protein [Aurantivibrio plasticivorans]